MECPICRENFYDPNNTTETDVQRLLLHVIQVHLVTRENLAEVILQHTRKSGHIVTANLSS